MPSRSIRVSSSSSRRASFCDCSWSRCAVITESPVLSSLRRACTTFV
jgi:hypothetical protein